MTNQPTPAGGEKDYGILAEEIVIDSIMATSNEHVKIISQLADLLRRSDELERVKAENVTMRERVRKLREYMGHALYVFTQTDPQDNAEGWCDCIGQCRQALAETTPEEGK